MTSKADIEAFLEQAFPASHLEILTVSHKHATIRRPVTPRDIRPGGTVSGPMLMGMADVALYVAIHATIGLTPQAVTSSLNINFLRRPSAEKAVIAVCTLLKVGKTLIVGEVSLHSEGDDEPVAHVVGTYSVPSVKAAGPR